MMRHEDRNIVKERMVPEYRKGQDTRIGISLRKRQEDQKIMNNESRGSKYHEGQGTRFGLS